MTTNTPPTLAAAIETLRRLPEPQQLEWAKLITKAGADQAYYDRRALQGLAEAERGDGFSPTEARERMEAHISARQR